MNGLWWDNLFKRLLAFVLATLLGCALHTCEERQSQFTVYTYAGLQKFNSILASGANCEQVRLESLISGAMIQV